MDQPTERQRPPTTHPVDWTIITPTVACSGGDYRERYASLCRLSDELYRQVKEAGAEGSVEHLVISTPPWLGDDGAPRMRQGLSVGEKVGLGFRQAKGRYVSVVDDDDEVAADYVSSVLAELPPSAAHSGVNVVTFGIRSPGLVPCYQRANIERDDYLGHDCDKPPEAKRGYNIKLANHLCVWRREIAASIPTLPRNYGWDRAWYEALRVVYPEVTERHIPRVLYTYHYDAERTMAQSRPAIAASQDYTGSHIHVVRDQRGNVYAGDARKGPAELWGADGRCHDLSREPGLMLLKEIVFG